jgi:hypothetical protein
LFHAETQREKREKELLTVIIEKDEDGYYVASVPAL